MSQFNKTQEFLGKKYAYQEEHLAIGDEVIIHPVPEEAWRQNPIQQK